MIILQAPDAKASLSKSSNIKCNAYLRSRTGTLSFFNESPSFFQNFSQDFTDILVSQERPIAFKKSAGDLMDSGKFERSWGARKDVWVPDLGIQLC